jgi:membrane dipeptidase
MVINISHGSDETVEQAIDGSADPVVATHHGLRSLNDIPRTMPDRLVRKLAAKGGVIGIHIGNEFHNRRLFEYRSKLAGRPFWDTSDIGKREAPLSIFEIDRLLAPRYPMVGIEAPDDLKLTVDGWIEVVEAAIAVAGEDHVGLGSDFDGGPTPPLGIRDARDYPHLTAAMLRRGWPEARIRKFLGENLRRVFREVTER